MRILLLILGGLLLGGAAHLAQVTDEGWLPIGPQAGGRVSALAVGPDGTLYAGTQDGALYARTPDIWLPMLDAPMSDTALTALHPGDPFYVGSTDGLMRLEDGALRSVAAVPAAPVRELTTDGSGGVLLVTVQGALYHAPNGSDWRALPVEGLPAAPVYRLLAHEQRLYAGTVGAGVYVHDNAAWGPLNEGLPAQIKVYALLPLPNGGLLAGTDAGAWALGPAGAWRRLGVGLDRQRVLDLALHDEPQGVQVLAASDDALYRLPLAAGAPAARDSWWTASATLVPLAAPVARVAIAEGQPFLAAGPVYQWAANRADRLGVALLGALGLVFIMLALWWTSRARG